MIRERKLWGERWLIYGDSTHTTNLLMLKKGRRCSWHRHQCKWNLFVVLSGKVGIRTIDGETILHMGEEFTVAPGEMHEFKIYEDGMMIEEMFVKYDDGDILRKESGGILNDRI